jgi:hypothetical protein
MLGFFAQLSLALSEEPNWCAETTMYGHLGRKVPPCDQSGNTVELEDLAADEMAFLIEMVMD